MEPDSTMSYLSILDLVWKEVFRNRDLVEAERREGMSGLIYYLSVCSVSTG